MKLINRSHYINYLKEVRNKASYIKRRYEETDYEGIHIVDIPKWLFE